MASGCQRPDSLSNVLATARNPCAAGTGAAYRTRTCDPIITNDVLYQLS